MKVAGVILAAGLSRRMGTDKLLLEIDGEPLLRRVVKVALASDISQVFVVLPKGADKRLEALIGLDVTIVIASDSSDGMGTSMRAGSVAIPSSFEASIFTLADMPEVTSADINLLIEAYYRSANHDICRAVSISGRIGHPVLFGREYFEQLKKLDGVFGAKNITRENSTKVMNVQTSGEGAILDLDTPEDWEKWCLNAKA